MSEVAAVRSEDIDYRGSEVLWQGHEGDLRGEGQGESLNLLRAGGVRDLRRRNRKAVRISREDLRVWHVM